MLQAGISAKEMEQINQLNIHGIFGERYMERVYPNGSLAGAVLGFVGRTDKSDQLVGRAGIEQQFDSVLAGTDGYLQVEVGPDGTIFPNAEKVEIAPQDGRIVKLTLDRDLQQAAEQILKEQVEKIGADWGSAVVLETNTGRVLAMADSQSYDPAKVAQEKPKSFTSNSVGLVLEPGSTGKAITVAAAINEGKVTPYSAFLLPTSSPLPMVRLLKIMLRMLLKSLRLQPLLRILITLVRCRLEHC
ncbi:penicillin-binding transpeptidase domain-containing protein [Arcanobacterium hippocoleae]